MSDAAVGRGHWLWGDARELARAPHTFPAEVGRRSGGLGEMRVLHRRILAVSDAELARQVLVTRQDRYERTKRYLDSVGSILGQGLVSTEGDFWLSHRRQMLPAFRREQLGGLAATTQRTTCALLEKWEAKRRAGEAIPLIAAMQELTIQVMGHALLSTALEGEDAARFGGAVRDALSLLRARNNARLRLPLWVPVAANRSLRRTRSVLDGFMNRHIAARKAQGAGTSDMLDSLLASRGPDTGAPFTDTALNDETKTLFVAGFETTAGTLTWALYLLARHPEVVTEWQVELDGVLDGRAPAWDDLERLPLTRAILNETMRLYPPVYNLPKTCLREDQLGGRTVRPGTILLVSIFGIHRSPDYWPAPDVFRPARFAPGAKYDRHTLLPFGVGKHACIGAEFAIAEMMVALALIGQRYRFALVDDTPVDMVPRITLAPSREIGLRITARAGS